MPDGCPGHLKTGNLVETIFAAGGVRPQITHTSILPTVLALVEAGMGAALVPAPVVPLHEGSLVSRPLSGVGDTALATLYCVWRCDNANPAVRAFADTLPGHWLLTSA